MPINITIYKKCLETIPTVLCVFFSLFLFSCVKTTPIRKVTLGQPQIQISGFSEEQSQVIKKTFLQLKSLAPGRLKIKKETYKRLSRFDSLFGFPFGGEQLNNWVSQKIKTLSYGNTWTVAINQNQETLVIGDQFFTQLTDLERLYLLIHEARHSDGDGFKHIKCPNGFPFVSSGQPEMDLENIFACDAVKDGAYAFQSAFLFELFAYGLFEQREVGLVYNSSVSRIIK